jgi:hypothetical protein
MVQNRASHRIFERRHARSSVARLTRCERLTACAWR